MNVSIKIKLFTLTCYNNALAIRSNHLRRQMRVENACALCGAKDETENHIFFRCEFSRVIWYCSSLQITPKASMDKTLCHAGQICVKDSMQVKGRMKLCKKLCLSYGGSESTE